MVIYSRTYITVIFKIATDLILIEPDGNNRKIHKYVSINFRLSAADYARWQVEKRLYEGQYSSDRKTHQHERQKQEPDDGIEYQGHYCHRPADYK